MFQGLGTASLLLLLLSLSSTSCTTHEHRSEVRGSSSSYRVHTRAVCRVRFTTRGATPGRRRRRECIGVTTWGTTPKKKKKKVFRLQHVGGHTWQQEGRGGEGMAEQEQGGA